MCCGRLAGNAGPKNRHLDTIAQLCRAISSQLRHISTIGKKLLKQQCLPHISSQYGELRPTSGWDLLASLRHPCKFQRVSRLGSVTARYTLVVGVSQTLRSWTEGATYIIYGRTAITLGIGPNSSFIWTARAQQRPSSSTWCIDVNTIIWNVEILHLQRL